MRQLVMARNAGVTLVAAAAGALLGAGPALADVTVSPTSAVQGSGENLTFHVTNTGTQPLATVTLRLPADTPVAEVYPLSEEDWAPRIDMRTLSSPLPTIHGDTTTTQTAGSITWFAMPGKALAPGGSADMGVAIGPLPTLSTMQFTVSTTYSGGKPGPVMPPATLELTPAAPGAAAETHAGHDGAGATTQTTADPSDAENAAFAAVVAQAQRGTSVWSIAGWVVAGLALLGGLGLVLRGRHRAEEDDEPDDDEADAATSRAGAVDRTADEPVAAGSKWSFRG